MNKEYSNKDYMKLAKILEKPYDEMGSYPWSEFMRKWVDEFKPKSLITLIIDCFSTLYGPSDLQKAELKEILCEKPLYLLGQYLLPEPSIEDPRSIFAEWRIAINK